jgi:hypothetical protein
MRKNHTLSLLQANKMAVGTWLQLGSYQVASWLPRLPGLAGSDLEHTPIDRRQLTTSTRCGRHQPGRCTPMAPGLQ